MRAEESDRKMIIPLSVKGLRFVNIKLRYYVTLALAMYRERVGPAHLFNMFEVFHDTDSEESGEEGEPGHDRVEEEAREEEEEIVCPDTMMFVQKLMNLYQSSPLARDFSHYTCQKKLVYLGVVTFPTMFVVTVGYFYALSGYLFNMTRNICRSVTPEPIWQTLVYISYLFFWWTGFFIYAGLVFNALAMTTIRVLAAILVYNFKLIQYYGILRHFGYREERRFARLEFDILLVGMNILGVDDVVPEQPPNRRHRHH